jgi:hypothetical protein
LSLFCYKIFTNNYIFKNALTHRKVIGATLKRIPNEFRIPNPELLPPDFGTGFGIYKSRGIGIGIPLGNTGRMAGGGRGERR